MWRAKKEVRIFDPTISMEDRMNEIVKTHNQIWLNMREIILNYKQEKYETNNRPNNNFK